MQTNVKIFILVIVLLIAGTFGLVFLQKQEGNSGPGVYDGFAMCLAEKGATFYGAFWCPHCNNQKKLFGKSKTLLPYVECSTPDGQARTQICIDKNIESYPTWEFADLSRLTGEVPLEQLAEKTGCVLPVE